MSTFTTIQGHISVLNIVSSFCLPRLSNNGFIAGFQPAYGKTKIGTQCVHVFALEDYIETPIM